MKINLPLLLIGADYLLALLATLKRPRGGPMDCFHRSAPRYFRFHESLSFA
jgi:hypothetical protein